MHQIKARVVAKEQISQSVYKLNLFAPAVAREAVPGQFVHVLCGANRTHLLRRPFSVHQLVGGESFEILFAVVGQGTGWLASLGVKDTVDLIGPLGRGFDLAGEGVRVLLVAGGMGVAPLAFLAHRLTEARAKVYTVMGAASEIQLLDFMDLKRLTRKITVATEDGSQGYRGLVTDVLPAAIQESRPERVYACGPEAMLRLVAAISARHGVGCQVSLESRMACGVGACLGCVVPAGDGYRRVCADGPVFDTAELGWLATTPSREPEVV